MNWIYNYSHNELKNELVNLGLKPYVTDQVFQWLYHHIVSDVSQWLNISKKNRAVLKEHFNFELIKNIDTQKDKQQTKKYLFELTDKNRIEAVRIKEKSHFTLCISSQVGCPLNCHFCATGKIGFRRNLSSGEILSQILILRKDLGNYKKKINIVFMGMGEPLLNYPSLKKALGIITAEKGISISPKNITVSTAGILEEIKRFEKEFPKIKISFSLNAADESSRKKLMPITNKESLDKILTYFRGSTRFFRITFEYILIGGINDSLSEAEKIGRLLRGIPCKINLIPYNKNENIDFLPPTEEAIDNFTESLVANGYTVVVRRSKGKDIKSACGQLAGKNYTNR